MTDAASSSTPRSSLGFYEALPTSANFDALGDPRIYAPLPDGWVVGVADIVRSTAAVARGDYKQVNTVAAAVIVAVTNSLLHEEFPFVFGGDGAGFALPAAQAEHGAKALAAVAGWAREAFGLDLRIALVSIEDIRGNGHDVRVARFSPSPDVSYAMFSGGGLAWAEQRMKAGQFRLEPATGEAARPDLSGLSCRFSEIVADRGLILSLMVLPVAGVDPARFADLAHDVLALAAESGDVGSPVPPQGPERRWPPAGMSIEAKVSAGTTGRPLLWSRASVVVRSFLAHLIFRSGLRVGSFDPRRYTAELVANTDFRKFDDGLRMTLDCTPSLADEIEARLHRARAEGVAKVGVHRQEAALMTCFAPSPSRNNHIHFIDGAAGGYSAAAAALLRDTSASPDC